MFRFMFAGAVACCVLLSSTVGGAVIIDDFDDGDLVSQIVNDNGAAYTWKLDQMSLGVPPGGGYAVTSGGTVSGGYMELGNVYPYWNQQTVTITPDLAALQFTVTNAGPADLGGGSAAVDLRWMVGDRTGHGWAGWGRASDVQTATWASLPAGGTVTITMPLASFEGTVDSLPYVFDPARGDRFTYVRMTGVMDSYDVGDRPNVFVDDIALIVPEPASLALLVMGGVALLRRRG